MVVRRIDPYEQFFKLTLLQGAMCEISFIFDLAVELNNRKIPLKDVKEASDLIIRSKTNTPEGQSEQAASLSGSSTHLNRFLDTAQSLDKERERIEKDPSINPIVSCPALRHFRNMVVSLMPNEYRHFRRLHILNLRQAPPNEVLGTFKKLLTKNKTEQRTEQRVSVEELKARISALINSSTSESGSTIFNMPSYLGTLQGRPIAFSGDMAHYIAVASGGGRRTSSRNVLIGTFGCGSGNQLNRFALSKLGHFLTTKLEEMVFRARIILEFIPNVVTNIDRILSKISSRYHGTVKQIFQNIKISYVMLAIVEKIQSYPREQQTDDFFFRELQEILPNDLANLLKPAMFGLSEADQEKK